MKKEYAQYHQTMEKKKKKNDSFLIRKSADAVQRRLTQ